MTHFRVLWEDVVHQSFVPRPQRPAAAADSWKKQNETFGSGRQAKMKLAYLNDEEENWFQRVLALKL